MKLFDGLHIVGGGDIGLSHPFDCNVYLVDGGEQMALIDAGVGLDPQLILKNVEEEGRDPSRIACVLITHAHPDHAGGAAWLSERLHCPVFAARDEAEIIDHGTEEQFGLQGKSEGDYLFGYRFPHVAASPLGDGETIRVGGVELTAIMTPGHSVCSTCYCFRLGAKRCLCSGDTVFIKGLVGLLNCHGFNMDAYRTSIRNLSGLGIDALLPGHLGFSLSGGQRHIDRAVDQFSRVDLPRHIGLIN